MWTVTPDGSIEDENGRVIFFSAKRFLDDICIGDCCFICGAKPDSKPFNNEHILPEWILRRYDLFARTITLPNGVLVRYDRYTIPCCVDCNTLMGEEFETPISTALHRGPEDFAEFIRHAGINIFMWLGLIFLKTHLKDRKYRIHLDQRLGNSTIADQYEWEDLHHLHSIVRCFYTGCGLDKDSVGSLLCIPVQEKTVIERFDYGDLLQPQTLFVKLDGMGMVVVFNDAGAATSLSYAKLRKITGPLSEIQLREIMVDFAYLNLRLKERPVYAFECDLIGHACRINTRRGSLDLTESDLTLRGNLMHYMFKDILRYFQHRNFTEEELSKAILNGATTFLFNDEGDFIKRSFLPLTC